MDGEKAMFIALGLSVVSLFLLIFGLAMSLQWIIIVGIIVKMVESVFFFLGFAKLAFG